MSLNFGGSNQNQRGTQSVQLPAPTAAETSLTSSNAELAAMQVQQMKEAAAQQAAYAKSPQGQADQQLQALATQNLLARLNGTAPVLTPAQQQMLDQAYSSSRDQGIQDLTRYAEEQAAARGMSTADSPIGADALRNLRLFAQDLQSKKAQSALDLSNTQGNFNQSIAQFQAGLQQQALQNRMALAATQPASYALQSNLFGQRLAAAPRSTTGNFTGNQNMYGGGIGDIGAAAGGVGGLMRGYASLYPRSGGGLSGGLAGDYM